MSLSAILSNRLKLWQLAMFAGPVVVLVAMFVLIGITGAFDGKDLTSKLYFLEAFLGLGAMLFPLAAFIYARGEFELARADASRNWPTVQGEVTICEVSSLMEQEATTYTLDFACDYAVNGRGYRTERVQFSAGRTPDKELIERLAAKYPVGTVVPVHYDPDDPEVAVLESSGELALARRGWVWFILGIVPFVALWFGIANA